MCVCVCVTFYCVFDVSVRLAYFDHLEERFDSALSNSMVVLAARKEAMQAEHELRMHLHQPRARRIEMDVHNARASQHILRFCSSFGFFLIEK